MNIPEITIAETGDWIALDKPARLLSVPDREGKEIALKTVLKEKYGNIYTVHRLDKETSGLILFAKNEEAHHFFSVAFEERRVEKIYRGLVIGSPPEEQGQIDAPIAEHPSKNGTMIIHQKGKPSRTGFEVLETFRGYSFLQWQLHTGRTHQIRVHMKNIGHPIVCDPVYGDGKPIYVSALRSRFKLAKSEEEERPILNRLALHAFRLGFTDQSGVPVMLEAPIPKDIRATCQQLSKLKK